MGTSADIVRHLCVFADRKNAQKNKAAQAAGK